MPVLTINMIQGRTLDQKRSLVDEVTKAVCKTISVSPDRVRIIINEVPEDSYAIAGELMLDKNNKG
jgi:4-oxalocrotonate tautomerase